MLSQNGHISNWDTYVCMFNECFSPTNGNGMQLCFCCSYRIIEVTPSHSPGKKLRNNLRLNTTEVLKMSMVPKLLQNSFPWRKLWRLNGMDLEFRSGLYLLPQWSWVAHFL